MENKTRRNFLKQVGLVGTGLVGVKRGFVNKVNEKQENNMSRIYTDVKIHIKEVIEKPSSVYRDFYKVIFSIDFIPGVPLTTRCLNGYHTDEINIGYDVYQKLFLVGNSWFTKWDGKKEDIEKEKYNYSNYKYPGTNVSIENPKKGLYNILVPKGRNFEELFYSLAKILVESQGKSFVYKEDKILKSKPQPHLEIEANESFKKKLRL